MKMIGSLHQAQDVLIMSTQFMCSLLARGEDDPLKRGCNYERVKTWSQP